MQLNVTDSGEEIININTQNAFILATVSISEALNIVSDVLGWIYFVAWSVSFYPQIYQGCKKNKLSNVWVIVQLNQDQKSAVKTQALSNYRVIHSKCNF